MATSRILRESVLSSPTVDKLSMGAEVFFYRLTLNADNLGRFEADPRLMLSRCFPLKIERFKVADVLAWFAELVEVGLVRAYTVGERLYGYFVTWAKYQRVRPYGSKLPAPPGEAEPTPAPTPAPEPAPPRELVVVEAAAGPEPNGGPPTGGGGGRIDPKLVACIRSLSLSGFHCLAEETPELEAFWDGVIHLAQVCGQRLEPLVVAVNSFYAGQPLMRQPGDLAAAKKAMEYGIRLRLGLVDERRGVRHA